MVEVGEGATMEKDGGAEQGCNEEQGVWQAGRSNRGGEEFWGDESSRGLSGMGVGGRGGVWWDLTR